MKTMLDALDLNSMANEFVAMRGSLGVCLIYMLPAWGWSHYWAGT